MIECLYPEDDDICSQHYSYLQRSPRPNDRVLNPLYKMPSPRGWARTGRASVGAYTMANPLNAAIEMIAAPCIKGNVAAR